VVAAGEEGPRGVHVVIRPGSTCPRKHCSVAGVAQAGELIERSVNKPIGE
jgi:hypothetical protein